MAAWSKIAWAGTDGKQRKSTDQCGTWHKWRAVPAGQDDLRPSDAQVNPDEFPYVVIPTSGLKNITGNRSDAIGREFRKLTGLARGDMGVVIYGDKWTPVFIADGGPFHAAGERFDARLRSTWHHRCRKWTPAARAALGWENQPILTSTRAVS